MSVFFRNKPPIPAPLPPQPIGKIDPKSALTISALAVTLFYSIGFVMRLVITPLLFLSATVVLAHIWVRPEKSRQIAKNILNQTPEAIKASIQNFPDAALKAYEITNRVYKSSLQYVGNKILPPSKSPHTLSHVATGVTTLGVQFAKDTYNTVQPKVVDCVESGLQMTENALTEAQKYATETAIPIMKDQFNKTFPPV